jgi:hypothetical protein
MSDDLDRRLRESLGSLPLPGAPRALSDAADRLEAEPVRPPQPRGPVFQAVPVLVAAVVLVSVLVWGGGARLGAAPSFSPGGSDQPAQSSDATPTSSDTSVATTEPSAAQAPTGSLTATDEGLSMVVTLSASDVEPGGNVTIDVTLRNDRSVAVPIGAGPCGSFATMYAELPVPLEPVGRDWEGVEGTFKQYALTEGLREGGSPMSRPGWAYANGRPCDDASSDTILEPGDSLTESMTWSAELVKGVPALPGVVPFTVGVAHDPTGAPPSYPPGYKGPLASWSRMYQQLAVTGTFAIVGEAPSVLSAGQAIDVMLSDNRFTKWLSRQPASTWSVANVFLQNPGKAQGIVPAGPSWDVELFREVGVARNWAIGFVDAYSGELLNLTFCNAPCSR